jgi:hypothetical protein
MAREFPKQDTTRLRSIAVKLLKHARASLSFRGWLIQVHSQHVHPQTQLTFKRRRKIDINPASTSSRIVPSALAILRGVPIRWTGWGEAMTSIKIRSDGRVLGFVIRARFAKSLSPIAGDWATNSGMRYSSCYDCSPSSDICMSPKSSQGKSIPVSVNNNPVICFVLESKIDHSIREYGGQLMPTETRCLATIERSRHESIAWVNASLVNAPMSLFMVFTSRQRIRALPNVRSRGLFPTRSRQRRQSEFRRIVIKETTI